MNFLKIQKYFKEQALKVTDYSMSNDGFFNYHHIDFEFMICEETERFCDNNFFEDDVVVRQIFIQSTITCKTTANLIEQFEKAMMLTKEEKPTQTSSVLDIFVDVISEEKQARKALGVV